jgi:hypothetical protein
VNDHTNPKGDPVGESLPPASALSPEQWREMCLHLQAECERLRAENAEFRVQSQKIMDMWFPEDTKEVTLSTEELLAQSVTEPSLLELIDNLERSQGSPEK